MRVLVDPRLEWAEMFENAWRLDRDVFFSKAMNGDDWPAVYKAYAKLLPELGSEDDFLWLLGQMQGEIASSHTFIGAGPSGGNGRPPLRTSAPTSRWRRRPGGIVSRASIGATKAGRSFWRRSGTWRWV